MDVGNADRQFVQQSEILTVEFAEARACTPGDDIRSIDWNAAAGYCQGMFAGFFVRRERLRGAAP